MKLYELILDDEVDGVDMIALVDEPAIKRGFIALKDQFIKPNSGEDKKDFLKRCIPLMIDEGKEVDQAVAICSSVYEDANDMQSFESYTDYPEAAKENARIALRWAEDNGWGDCGTDVGKQRANQLAKGEPISEETIARMAAFERHRQNSDKELGDGCGRLMWLAWGGDEGIEWAQRKLEQIRKEKMHAFKVQNEEKRIVMGPIMVANLPIYRYSEDLGSHYVVFRPHTIEQIVLKFFKNRRNDQANIMHDGVKVDGVYLYESFIIDDRKPTPEGFDKLPNGSWFGTFKVENDEVWNRVKNGEFSGFSIEGLFAYAEKEKEMEDELLAKLLDVLKG